MLSNVAGLHNYTIDATTGFVGEVRDFLFDDESWVIRYLMVETGEWLARRKVLISPHSAGEPNWDSGTIPVSISREQVGSSPSFNTAMPVSRQHEMRYLDHFGYPYYWAAGRQNSRDENPRLYSCESVARYTVRAADGEMGQVRGFLFDSGTWAIRQLVVNSSRSWLGRKILVAPEWIERVNWQTSTISFKLSRRELRSAPSFGFATQSDPANVAY